MVARIPHNFMHKSNANWLDLTTLLMSPLLQTPAVLKCNAYLVVVVTVFLR